MTTRRRFGLAWIALTLAFALHNMDEALNGFLDIYNPNVLWIRQQIGLPFPPTFTFAAWIGGLAIAFVLLLAASRWAFAGARWTRRAAWVYAGIMFANGCWHAAASLYFGRFMPGVYSSPLLWAASTWLIMETRRREPRMAAAGV